MQRSHAARKHRSAKDRTDEGVFDSAAEASKAKERRALQKGRSAPTRHKTVRHMLAGGIATTVLMERGSDGASTPGSDEGDGGPARGMDGKNDGVGVDDVGVARLAADDRSDASVSGSASASSPRAPSERLTPESANPSSEDVAAGSPTKRRASICEGEEAGMTETPMSTQRGPSRSLREYESMHPTEDSPDRAASPDAADPSGPSLMEDLLSRGSASGRDGADVRKVDVKKVKGIALMLEVAKADDLPSVLGCVEEYGLDLTSVACVNTSGTSALHAAASGGALRVARHLVTKMCVDVNAKDNWGNTPLDEAQRAGSEEMCRFLIAAGGQSESRGDAFSNHPFAVRKDLWSASPSGSRGGSSHGGDIAYLALNTSPAEVTRTYSRDNLAMLVGGAELARTPRRGGMRRRRNSLSDLCVEALRHKHENSASRSPIRVTEVDGAPPPIRVAEPRRDTSSPESHPSPRSRTSPEGSETRAENGASRDAPSSASERIPDAGGYDFAVHPSAHTTLTEELDGHDEWEVMAWDVRVDRKVGEGAFGEIRRATWRGVDVAVKTLKADCASDAIALKEFNREMSIWSRLVHPNVVQFLGVGYKHETPRLMLCEYMQGGSLQQKLMQMNASGKKFLFDQGFAVIKGVAGAMSYMHSRRPFAVIHRDLKPANILLTAAGEAKVADFGLSKMLDIDTPRAPRGVEEHGEGVPFDDSAHDERGRGGAESDAATSSAQSAAPPPSPLSVPSATPARRPTPEERAAHELLETRRLDYGEQVYSQLYDHSFLMTGETGAYKYMAPEVFKNELYGLKCDVYSFAMIAYEVFEGIMLMRDPVSWAHSAAGPDETRPAWMFLSAYDTRRTTECIELLEQCWHGDPKERPTFMKIGSEFKRIARIPRSERPRASSKKKLRASSGSKVGGLKTGSGGSGSLVGGGDAPPRGENEQAPQCVCAVM